MSGGWGAFKKTENTSFTFSMTNVTILSICRTHAQNEYHKVFEMKRTFILTILVLSLFEKNNVLL